MNIVILSRNAALYSTNSLVMAALKRGHDVRVIDHFQCDLVLDNNLFEVYYNGLKLTDIDAIIPRIGYSATSYGASVLRQFEFQKIFSTLSSSSLLLSRDKLSCLQTLIASGIPVPRTGITNNQFSIKNLLQHISQPPYIVKLLQGTQGLGVILSESTSNAESILEAFLRTQDSALVQKFIPESKGSDLRVFVVGNRIVGAMKRQALEGEFRSNLHRGGFSYMVKLTSQEEEIAIKSSQVLGVPIAGIDILQSNEGPLVIEVNVSPGLEGIEGTTQYDIASEIIKYIEENKSSK
jgi:ribosomal protein S6--L-glutamate ligase